MQRLPGGCSALDDRLERPAPDRCSGDEGEEIVRAAGNGRVTRIPWFQVRVLVGPPTASDRRSIAMPRTDEATGAGRRGCARPYGRLARLRRPVGERSGWQPSRQFTSRVLQAPTAHGLGHACAQTDRSSAWALSRAVGQREAWPGRACRAIRIWSALAPRTYVIGFTSDKNGRTSRLNAFR